MLTKFGGSLARIGPHHLLTDSPETARRVLEARSGYVRSSGYDSFKHEPKIGNVVSEQDISKHDYLRRQLAPGVFLYWER